LVKYIGTANTQTIAGDAGDGGDGFNYSNVELNNTYGTSPQFYMTATEGNATIPNTGSTGLVTTSGIVSSLSSAMFVINSGALCGIGNANCYIDGPIKKIGQSTFVFPVGSSAIGWARLAVSNYNLSGTNTEFTCQHFSAASPSNTAAFMGTAYGPALNHVSYVEYWDLQRVFDVGNNATCQVTLYWENATNSGITTSSDLRVGHFELTGTNKWENQGQGSISFGATGNITSATALANFSPVSFGSQGGINPLPIELLNFDAIVCGQNVCLNWSTATEINNDFFTVERSQNGIDFEIVGIVDGAGNSSYTRHYNLTDEHPYIGTSYYRLKQTDFNGEYKYFNLVAVDMINKITSSVFPNPSGGEAVNVVFENINENESVQLNVYDAIGNLVISKFFVNTVKGGRLATLINSDNALAPGVYYIVGSYNDRQLFNQKLVITP